MTKDDGPLVSIEEVVARLDRVEQRLAALERGERAEAEPLLQAQAFVPAQDEGPLVTTGTLPLIGRTVLVLGGAYLLRAITEAGAVPQEIGSVLGLAYAVAWLVLADRVAARARMGDATFHGLATTIIVFPLLWETTVTFGVVPPAIGAALLLSAAGAGLFVAWHRRLPALAWVIAAGAVPTSIALGFASHELTPFLACLLVLGLATMYLGEALSTVVLATVVALVIDVVFLFLTVAVVLEPGASALGGLGANELLLLLIAFLSIYWGGGPIRALLRRRELGWIALLQSVLTLGIAVGGAAALALSTGAPRALVGAALLALAAASYAASFVPRASHEGRGRTFHLYAAAALSLTLVAGLVGLERAPAAQAFALAAAVAGALGFWRRRSVLALHTATFGLAAAIISGLLPRILQSFVGDPGGLAGWTDPGVIAALAAVAAAFAFSSGRAGSDELHGVARVAVAFLSLLVFTTAAALACTIGAEWLPKSGSGATDAAALATLRTGVLAAAALGAIGMGRRARFHDLRFVAYELLAVGALKLLVEDLRVGHAATLFLSLALYGGALVLMSRLMRTTTAPRGG